MDFANTLDPPSDEIYPTYEAAVNVVQEHVKTHGYTMVL